MINFKRVRTTIISVVLASSIVVTPVFAAPSVDDLKENKAQAQSEVSSLQTQLSGLMVKLDECEEKLIENGEKIEQAKTDLQAAEEKEKQQYADMKTRIKYMYEQGDTQFLEALVESKDFADLINKADYVQNVHKYDRKMLTEYVDTKQQIADLETSLEKEQTTLEKNQADFDKQKTEVNTLITSKQAQIADFDTQIQAAAEEAARQAAARAAAQQAAAAQARNRSQAQTNNNNNNSNRENNRSDDNDDNNKTTPVKKPSTSGSSNANAGTGNSAVGQRIVSAAASQLGVPYVWGGTSPGVGLDCSGLVQYAHRVAGISVSRTSGAIGGGGKGVSVAMPGDVVCYSGHVGIYAGGGQMIHAPHTGAVVRYQSVYGSPWYRRYW